MCSETSAGQPARVGVGPARGHEWRAIGAFELFEAVSRVDVRQLLRVGRKPLGTITNVWASLMQDGKAEFVYVVCNQEQHKYRISSDHAVPQAITSCATG